MNFIQLVGIITAMPVAVSNATNVRYSEITVEVKSNFRDISGLFRIDIFKVRLWRGISDTVVEMCKVNELIAIKGRMEIDGDRYVIIAEHVEFLR